MDTALQHVRRRFWVSATLAVPLLAIAMLPPLFSLSTSDATAHVLRAAQLALSLPAVLWAAAGYYQRGWQGLRNRSPNMYTLIGLGVAVTYLYSLLATFLPGRLSHGHA